MRKFTLLILFVFTSLFGHETFAQRGAYNEGDKIFMGGVGFGTFGTYGGIPLTASLEFGVHRSISVGGFVGYSGSQWWNTFAVGAKGTWHFLPVLNRELELNVDDDRWDFYVSGYLGFRSSTFGRDRTIYGNYGANYSGPLFSGALGAKYFFTPSAAGFLELGGPLGWTNLGVSLTF